MKVAMADKVLELSMGWMWRPWIVYCSLLVISV